VAPKGIVINRPVTYGGSDVPPRARVRELLVADGADVNQGDALLALDL
jgi:multidrug efflux pump subunit AcrA (membrane-fusion protein)